MTLIALALLRSRLGQTPHLLFGVTGWLRPVGEKASVAEAMADTPATHAWSKQPLIRLMTVEFLLALGQRPRHDSA